MSCCNGSHKDKGEYQQITGYTQGTTFTVTYKDSLNRNFQYEIDSLLQLIDFSVSTYQENSSISKFNTSIDTSNWLSIDTIFYQNLLLSKQIYEITGGSFDPTVGPLFSYFNFEDNGLEYVDSIKIKNILENSIGLDFIELNIETREIKKKKPNLTLNFNAIAQGYSVDFIAVDLDRKGINDYMIEVGGEILTKGKNPSKLDWKLGIDNPKDNSRPGDDIQKIVELSGKALATSGNYRKFYTIGNKRYSHTLNPKTGFPVDHNLLSVSVIANTCAEADAYATAFMVMGVEKSLQVISTQHLDVEAYFISSIDSVLIENKSSNF